MKQETQSSIKLTQLAELIEDISTAMLTTRQDSGLMVSRPMSPLLMDADGAIWFFTDKTSAKTQHLDDMNLSFVDASDGTYVSISGSGRLVDDQIKIDELWTAFARPWFPEGKDSANLTLLRFDPHLAEYWDGPQSKMVRFFATGASIVAGKPVGMGDHAVLTDLKATLPLAKSLNA